MAHTAEAKATVLRQLANGTPVKELCRTYDIPRSTLYRWSRDLESSNMTSEVPSPKGSTD